MKVEYDLDDLLALLVCAEVYSFGHDILYATLINEMNIGKNTIDDYIYRTYIKSDNNYEEEDIEQYRNVLYSLFKMYKK